MRFRVLGPLEVLSEDRWTSINAPKWRSLLACLLVRPGHVVSTETLIFELWGDNQPSTANNMVSIYVHRLRKVIGDQEGRLLVRRAPGYLLHVTPGDLDLHAFESLVADGRVALAAGDPQRAVGLLSEALELWRGPLLSDVPPFPLLDTQAERAAEQRLAAIELRIEADIGCGGAAAVVAELRGLVAEHPLREGFWALLIRALDAAGRHAEALGAYARVRQVISDELGVDPGTELQRLYAALLAADTADTADTVDTADAAAEPAQAPPAFVTGFVREKPAALGIQDGPAPHPRAGEGPEEAPGTIAIGAFADADETPPTAAQAQAEAPAGPWVPPPAQLPADIGDFTGRGTHVEHLCQLLVREDVASGPGAVRIAVVNGAGGLGKTTLAVHAAHQVRAEFPDGQLYVDLLGASPQPADPGEVLARFLRDLGVDGDKVPVRDDERAALYRTRLTGRRVLVVLDNAKDAAQVRPLLPGSSACAVLLTTRNRTQDLASTRFFDLDVLEDTEALALFSKIVGEERSAAEPDATAEVLVACAGLPLAIRICAARLAARRQWRIATLAGRLRDQHRRLDELSIGDLAVRASFQVSYDSLGSSVRGVDTARAFRLLGLWQGQWISLAAAAALLGEPEHATERALETLVDANLIESPAPGWYRLHDLLRVYATERAQAEESEAARSEAVRRLLRWYLESAEAAAGTISPQRYQVPLEPAPAGHPPLEFADAEEVLAWYSGERANVIAATRQAAAEGLHVIAWRLPAMLWPLFARRSNWADCVAALRVALESAREVGHRPGEAWVLYQLGWALTSMRDETAFGHLEQSLAIRRELGDTIAEAQAALGLGEAYLRMRGAGADALPYMRRAEELLRPTGASSLRGTALNNLGEVYWELGDLEAAAECYAQARDILREIGGYEGHALHNLARVYLHLHRVDDAVAALTDALRLHRALGDLVGEATALNHFGHAHKMTGDLVEAKASWVTALAIFEQIGAAAEAAEVADELLSLTVGNSQRESPALR